MEKWKKIKGYSYKVSNLGNVKRIESKVKTSNGRVVNVKEKHLTVKENAILCNKGKSKIFKVSRLVAIYFISNPFKKECVNHIDGNKLNNNVNNLEWVTRKEISVHSLSKTEKARYERKFDDEGKKYILENKGIIKPERLAKIFKVSLIDIKRIIENEKTT